MSLFGFHKVKWLQYTGEVVQAVGAKLSQDLTPKVIKIGKFLTELFEK